MVSVKGQIYTLVSLLHKGDEDAGTSIADMSDDETICGCNGVDKGTIVNAITSKGLTSVDEVTKATKAGNSCGKCKGQIGEVITIYIRTTLLLQNQQVFVHVLI